MLNYKEIKRRDWQKRDWHVQNLVFEMMTSPYWTVFVAESTLFCETLAYVHFLVCKRDARGRLLPLMTSLAARMQLFTCSFSIIVTYSYVVCLTVNQY